jgi:hypothetical protein
MIEDDFACGFIKNTITRGLRARDDAVARLVETFGPRICEMRIESRNGEPDVTQLIGQRGEVLAEVVIDFSGDRITVTTKEIVQ